MCLIPDFNGAIFSSEWKKALRSRFYTGAPRRLRLPRDNHNENRVFGLAQALIDVDWRSASISLRQSTGSVSVMVFGVCLEAGRPTVCLRSSAARRG